MIEILILFRFSAAWKFLIFERKLDYKGMENIIVVYQRKGQREMPSLQKNPAGTVSNFQVSVLAEQRKV